MKEEMRELDVTAWMKTDAVRFARQWRGFEFFQ